MSTENAATFDCPECDVSAPSTSVPYDSLGYVVCPVCGYAATPDPERSPGTEGPPSADD
jgi:transcription elongation factor Elf1